MIKQGEVKMDEKKTTIELSSTVTLCPFFK